MGVRVANECLLCGTKRTVAQQFGNTFFLVKSDPKCLVAGMVLAKITECFQIKGRGTVVVINAKTELPIGRCLDATIFHHDGKTETYDAWKEWLLRRSKEPVENEAFLIVDVTIEQIPNGGSITLQIKDN